MCAHTHTLYCDNKNLNIIAILFCRCNRAANFLLRIFWCHGNCNLNIKRCLVDFLWLHRREFIQYNVLLMPSAILSHHINVYIFINNVEILLEAYVVALH